LGFGLARQMKPEGRESYNPIQSVISQTLTYSSQPENSWLLMGMEPGPRYQAFTAMVAGPIELNYGHATSIVSRLKYKILQVEPPSDYYSALADFRKWLNKKYDGWLREFNRFGAKMAEVSPGDEILPAKPPAKLFVLNPKASAVEDTVAPSLFNTRLETLYAIRALGVFAEKELAVQTLFALLPDHWELSRAEQKYLLQQVTFQYGDKLPLRVRLSAEARRTILADAFSSLPKLVGVSEARRLLIRWLAGLKDAQLANEARKVFADVTCVWALTPN
jgi:hypothetical protein